MTIWHLAHRDDWRAALDSGEYRISTRGATLDDVGFIHASYSEQLSRVAEFVYADDDRELCVLVLDENRIRADGVLVADEDGGDGELFPHIYGPIKPSWVLEVREAGFDADKKFRC
ncbi:DUF952 domain-containing protein [Gryllotalpicola ginsengisoli]|uniref:DUF952 domain-containing protein n=1 Tax=Gryllotalpicola ginsengisoli TaxID=444608 RepID=UPI0004191983|nr:DUF952 domain-containing protein [Gryllotalpicola ginsengisoli]